MASLSDMKTVYFDTLAYDKMSVDKVQTLLWNTVGNKSPHQVIFSLSFSTLSM